jgi:hypothetical protein
LAILSVKLSLRRLPAITTMLWGVAMERSSIEIGQPVGLRVPRQLSETMQVHELEFRALAEPV